MLAKIFKPGTLLLSRPFGNTFLLSLIIFPFLVGFSELFSRTILADPVFPPPSVGAANPEFDVKLDHLNQLIKRDGSIECLLVGSSQIDGGIDPVIIDQAYAQKTGKKITCYNIGISTVTREALGVLAQVLENTYLP